MVKKMLAWAKIYTPPSTPRMPHRSPSPFP